jgi:hypothetical protein
MLSLPLPSLINILNEEVYKVKIELDVKTLITLGGIVAMLSGFVYTTRMQFDLIDTRLEQLETRQSVFKKRLKSRDHKIKKH